MGSQLSFHERQQEEARQRDMLYEEAIKKYNMRMNNYHYNPHMPYWRYEKICRAQFELDLLPEHLKYGTHYSGTY